MARDYEYELEITAETRDLDKAEQAVRDLETALDGTDDTARDALNVLGGLADELEFELKGTADAADALKLALGDAFDGDSARVEQMVQDLRGMGLEFDQIKQNATEFAGVMQRTDQIKLDAVNSGLTRVSGSLDRVRSNSDQSRSVLANLAGNAAQDIGELGGVVGTLGVGIGQLAEYAVDGNIALRNLAKVAGPMAGVAAATLLIQSTLEGIAKTKAWRTEQVEGFQDAIREAGEGVQSIRDYIVEMDKLEFRGPSDGLFGPLRQQSEDLIPILGNAGVVVSEVAAVLAGTEDDIEEFGEYLRGIGVDGDDVATVMQGLTEVQKNYANSLGEGTAAQQFFRQNIEAWNEDFQSLVTDGLEPAVRFGDDWTTVMDDIADGAIDTAAAQNSLNNIMAELGTSNPDDVLNLFADALDNTVEAWARANQELDANVFDERWAAVARGAEALRQGGELTADQWESLGELVAETGMTEADVLTQGAALWDEHREKIDAYNETVKELQASLDEVADSLTAAADRGDAFTAALDNLSGLSELTQSGELISFVGGMNSVTGAIDDLEEAMSAADFAEIDLVPDSWEEVLNMPEELGPVVDAIAGFAGDVQTEMAQAFEEGGVEGVQAWAEDTRNAITNALLGAADLTDEQVQEILASLGLLDGQVVAFTIEATDERARNVLAGLESTISLLSPTVQLEVAALALDDPVAALELVVAALEAQNIEIPATLTALVDEFNADVDAVTDEERNVEIDTETPNLPQTKAALDLAVKPRKAPIEPEISAQKNSSVFTALKGLAAPRTAVITAEAHTFSANTALDSTASARSAAIDAYLRFFPSASEIISRMTDGRGYLRIPVDTYPRNIARLKGTR